MAKICTNKIGCRKLAIGAGHSAGNAYRERNFLHFLIRVYSCHSWPSSPPEIFAAANQGGYENARIGRSPQAFLKCSTNVAAFVDARVAGRSEAGIEGGRFEQGISMRTSTRAMIAAMSGVVLCGSALTARADFLLESQDFSMNQQTANFSLTFNQAPDFYTLDSLGRPADSFQIDFNGAYSPNPGPQGNFVNNFTSVVRGDEIHVANNIRIRGTAGDGGPNSGGWGAIVGAVPFSLIGDTISFSVPTKDLGWTGHSVQFTTLSLADGAQTSSRTVTMVPTPRAFPAGVAGLFVMAGATFIIRRRSAHRAG